MERAAGEGGGWDPSLSGDEGFSREEAIPVPSG